MNPRTHDIGEYYVGFNALDANVVVSSVGGGAEQNGNALNRLTFIADRRHRSCKVSIPYDATGLTGGATVTLTANVQDGASTAAWTDYDDKDGSTANTAVATTGAPNGVLSFDVDLARARQYVRVQVTPTFSAATVDTVAISCVLALGGAEKRPSRALGTGGL